MSGKVWSDDPEPVKSSAVGDIVIVLGILVAANILIAIALGPCYVKAFWMTLIGLTPDPSCVP